MNFYDLVILHQNLLSIKNYENTLHKIIINLKHEVLESETYDHVEDGIYLCDIEVEYTGMSASSNPDLFNFNFLVCFTLSDNSVRQMIVTRYKTILEMIES